MRRKFVFLVPIICGCTIFAAAQKNVGTRQKSIASRSAGMKVFQEPHNKNLRPAQTPVKILEKPRAAYPNQDRGSVCIQGKVVLRVTFSATGEIGAIFVISGLGNGATASSVEAARKIKFKPATKNGKPITVTKPVEYVFTIY